MQNCRPDLSQPPPDLPPGPHVVGEREGRELGAEVGDDRHRHPPPPDHLRQVPLVAGRQMHVVDVAEVADERSNMGLGTSVVGARHDVGQAGHLDLTLRCAGSSR